MVVKKSRRLNTGFYQYDYYAVNENDEMVGGIITITQIADPFTNKFLRIDVVDTGADATAVNEAMADKKWFEDTARKMGVIK